jgi:hypothetical protein
MFTATQIGKVLTSCKFNPKKPGVMKILADVRNIDYYINQAIIELKECESEHNSEIFREKIKRVIQLAVLSVLTEESLDA